MSNAKLMWITPQAEYMMAYIARGSNPTNQANPEFRKLFEYMLKHDHWSPFQMASMCVEIETSLAIAGQVKRHWSIACCEPADIQETSMRYMDPFEHGWGFQEIEFRETATNNRQSSKNPLNESDARFAQSHINEYLGKLRYLREYLKVLGVANETIRMLYPQATTTRFYLAGSCRSWIHYFQQRLSEHAQFEHQVLGLQIWDIFVECFPTVAEITLLKGNASVEAQTKVVNETFRKEKEDDSTYWDGGGHVR